MANYIIRTLEGTKIQGSELLVVSGSTTILSVTNNNVTISGSVDITDTATFTKSPIFLDSGSISVTSSWAENAITASYINPTFISASAAAAGFGSGGGDTTAVEAQFWFLI